MKKILSLIALVLVLSSFVPNSVSVMNSNEKTVNLDSVDLIEKPVISEKVDSSLPDCFDVASAAADNWMVQTGGSWDDSVDTYDKAYEACTTLYYVLNLLATYME